MCAACASPLTAPGRSAYPSGAGARALPQPSPASAGRSSSPSSTPPRGRRAQRRGVLFLVPGSNPAPASSSAALSGGGAPSKTKTSLSRARQSVASFGRTGRRGARCAALGILQRRAVAQPDEREKLIQLAVPSTASGLPRSCSSDIVWAATIGVRTTPTRCAPVSRYARSRGARAPDTARLSPSATRHSCSTPTLIPRRRVQITQRLLRGRDPRSWRFTRQIEAVLRERDLKRARQVTRATTQLGRIEAFGPAARSPRASTPHDALAIERLERANQDRGRDPSGSVTAFTR